MTADRPQFGKKVEPEAKEIKEPETGGTEDYQLRVKVLAGASAATGIINADLTSS